MGDDFRYPLNGEIYEAITDVEIYYMVHWKAPYTDGGTFTLKKGERIKVEVSDHNPQPINVYAASINKERLEREIIPDEIRTAEKYGSYSLSVESAQLNQYFSIDG